MRLLIIVPHQDRASGNWVTARRFADGLTARGHAVVLCDTADGPQGLCSAVDAARPELVLLLHAWRSGGPWLESGSRLPFMVLLTGTDVNPGLTDPAQLPVIAAVLARAAGILTQNRFTAGELARAGKSFAARIRYLPPGIILGAAPYPLSQPLGRSPGEVVFLCAAGIRPVKGVLELLVMCDQLTRDAVPVRLVFCGPVLDAGYGRRLQSAIAARPWATWLGVVPPEAMPDLMRQVDVVVSNSFSEGLPNALVEAAVLGRPILARDIPGNAAVVNTGKNGLLYRDEAGFLDAAGQLCADPALRIALSRPDPQRFAAAAETAALESICNEILQGRTGPCNHL